jgi:hypothetical protein
LIINFIAIMKDKDRTILFSVLAIVIVVMVIIAWWMSTSTQQPSNTASSTSPTSNPNITNQVLDKSISPDGIITIAYPSKDFGLATNPTQVLVTSYIPPCDMGFDYCLYYNGSNYKNTNFESAGIRVSKRADLSTERACLQTPPAGFNAAMLPTASTSANAYSSTIFDDISTGAAGHSAAGSLYRLYVRQNSKCYEFETRVGQSQFANYPVGEIDEFTSAQQASLLNWLEALVNNVSLPGTGKNLFGRS